MDSSTFLPSSPLGFLNCAFVCSSRSAMDGVSLRAVITTAHRALECFDVNEVNYKGNVHMAGSWLT